MQHRTPSWRWVWPLRRAAPLTCRAERRMPTSSPPRARPSPPQDTGHTHTYIHTSNSSTTSHGKALPDTTRHYLPQDIAANLAGHIEKMSDILRDDRGSHRLREHRKHGVPRSRCFLLALVQVGKEEAMMMMMMRLSAETTQVRGTTYRGEGRIRLGEVCSVPQQLFHHSIVATHDSPHQAGQPILTDHDDR